MAGPDASPLLDVRGLSVRFALPGATVRAVDDVSFVVGRGETLALVGESGCGKSVTALAVLRLVQPPGRIVAGQILFEGRNLLALGEREMRSVRGARISLVLQEPATALNPVFTIGDQIIEAVRVHRRVSRAAARERAVDLLAAVRMPGAARRMDDYPHQMSGGMRQRALIAMALACEPELLIADEPTTALDVTIQAETLDLLAELKARYRLALLLITHDLGIVAGMADRVAVMYAGRLVEQGDVGRVFRAAAHPYTRALLASARARTPGERLPAIEGTVPDLASLPPGCAFVRRCPERLPACDVEVPPPRSAAPGHVARCHLLRAGDPR
jgi:oligopeptide/dipeptide ABC transporter ATP-binding protein